ncbi:MAG: hypothetical protein GTN76_07380 [Candidatus Aenigmarchaeota archaeon]|nr:hypothetical protein [Candidatus Aenigmarchaeota archaeon]
MKDQSLTHIQIRTVFYVIKKHKWKIMTLFLSTVITVAVGSLLATPIYRASSRLLVKPGREDIYVLPTRSSPAIIDYSRGVEKVNAEIAIIKSSGLIVELVERFGVQQLFDFPDLTLKGWLVKKGIFKETREREIPPVERVYKSVQDNLEVSGYQMSNVIYISFHWPDPVIAAQAINTLVDLYFAQHVKVHTDPHTYNLLKDQAEKWEKKLTESEYDLESFKRRHAVTSLPQQKTILLGKLSEFESQKKQTENEIKETEGTIASLEAQLSNPDEDSQLQETVNQASPMLAALRAKLVELELQGLKGEINRVKQMIAEEEKKNQVVVVSGNSPKDELLKAKVRLEALKAREKNLKLQIATYPQELKTLNLLEKELKELERQVAINETNYKLYLTKFEEAKILETMDRKKIASVSVIEPAVPIMKPVKPRKRLNVMIGGFLGLFAGIGMAFLIEFINPVFRTREDVDQFLGLPVLATLPKEK